MSRLFDEDPRVPCGGPQPTTFTLPRLYLHDARKIIKSMKALGYYNIEIARYNAVSGRMEHFKPCDFERSPEPDSATAAKEPYAVDPETERRLNDLVQPHLRPMLRLVAREYPAGITTAKVEDCCQSLAIDLIQRTLAKLRSMNFIFFSPTTGKWFLTAKGCVYCTFQGIPYGQGKPEEASPPPQPKAPARMVYTALACARANNGKISTDTLTAYAQCSPDLARSTIRTAQTLGLLEYRGGRNHHYILTAKGKRRKPNPLRLKRTQEKPQ